MTSRLAAIKHPSPNHLDTAFLALSDSTRREMICSLLTRPRRAGELAELVTMSPQALSRHLRVLRKAGLVVEEGIETDARVRLYSVHPTAFAVVKDWLSEVEDRWQRQLNSFKAYAESGRTGRSKL